MCEALCSSLGATWKYIGYCPPAVTDHIRRPMTGYIQPYYDYYPTVTEGGQYSRNTVPKET